MQEAVRSNTDQEWPTGKIVGTLALLVLAVLACFFVPVHLLTLAGEALDRRDRETADLLEEWSLGLVALGPSFFVTSVLAMASQLPSKARVLVRVAALALSLFILYLLKDIGPSIQISVLLCLVGVIYCLVADSLTPNSKGGAKPDVGSKESVAEPKPDVETKETVAVTEKTDAAAISASLEPRSPASQLSNLVTLMVSLAVLVVAIVLDLLDRHAARNRRGATRRSR